MHCTLIILFRKHEWPAITCQHPSLHYVVIKPYETWDLAVALHHKATVCKQTALHYLCKTTKTHNSSILAHCQYFQIYQINGGKVLLVTMRGCGFVNVLFKDGFWHQKQIVIEKKKTKRHSTGPWRNSLISSWTFFEPVVSSEVTFLCLISLPFTSFVVRLKEEILDRDVSKPNYLALWVAAKGCILFSKYLRWTHPLNIFKDGW